MKWQEINSEQVYDGFFKLSLISLTHELFQGGDSTVIRRELIDKGQAVAVLPYDPDRDEVVLVEQFRIGAIHDSSGPWLMEIIAGYIEPGESPENVAHREAEEEAECYIRDLRLMHRCYSSPGGTNEQLHLYFALTDTRNVEGIHGLDHEGEDIRVHVVPTAQAFQWLDEGRISSVMPIIALQWLRLNLADIRQQYTQDSSPA
jgi:ADP-ribose pyrophosphatase